MNLERYTRCIGSERFLPPTWVDPTPDQPVQWEELICPEDERLRQLCALMEPEIWRIHGHDPTGHNAPHVVRVMGYNYIIASREGYSPEERFISTLAAGKHEYHRHLEYEHGIPFTAEDAMPMIERWLQESEIGAMLTQGEKEGIRYCVRFHDFTPDQQIPTTLWQRALFSLMDADRIDSLGPRGERRNKNYCIYHRIPAEQDERYRKTVLHNLPYVMHSDTAKKLSDVNYRFTLRVSRMFCTAKN